MSAIKGDFTGFTFNGIHSSELGITRVSDGSRYTENLLPTIQDKTVQVPGADGTYYFGTFYTQRPINISVAFDDMTEEQLRSLKTIFGDKKIHQLIFDEVPYKVYKVKSTGTPNLKYVCFSRDLDPNDRDYHSTRVISSKEELYGSGARSPFGRIYKGEGQLNFVAYEPFAYSRFKYLDEYTFQNIPEWGSMDSPMASDVNYNFYDWQESSRMRLSNTTKIVNNTSYRIDKVNSNGIMIYNAGDFPVHFNLYFLFSGSFNGCTINSAFSEIDGFLTIGPFTLKSGDIGVRVNGKLNLIEGIVEDPNSISYEQVRLTYSYNPRQEGWYVLSGNNYVLSTDTIAQNNRTYYRRLVTYVPTGNIYNEYIDSGDFFKLPVTEDLTWVPLSPLSGSSLSAFTSFIEYDYLYF